MKKCKISWLVALALVVSVVAVQAQERPIRKGEKVNYSEMTQQEREQMAQKKMDRMTQELNLTPEQRKQIEAVQHERMQRRAEARQSAQQDREKIRQVLTPEQQAKWDSIRHQHKGHGPKGAPCCKPGAPCDKAQKMCGPDKKPCCKGGKAGDKATKPCCEDKKGKR